MQNLVGKFKKLMMENVNFLNSYVCPKSLNFLVDYSSNILSLDFSRRNPSRYLRKELLSRLEDNIRDIKYLSFLSSFLSLTDKKLISYAQQVRNEEILVSKETAFTADRFKVTSKLKNSITLKDIEKFFSSFSIITEPIFLNFLKNLDMEIIWNSKESRDKFVLHSFHTKMGLIEGSHLGLCFDPDYLVFSNNPIYQKNWKFEDIHTDFRKAIFRCFARQNKHLGQVPTEYHENKIAKNLKIEDEVMNYYFLKDTMIESKTNNDFKKYLNLEYIFSTTDYGKQINHFLGEKLIFPGGELLIKELLFFGRFEIEKDFFVPNFKITEAGRKYLSKWESPKTFYWIAMGGFLMSFLSLVVSIFIKFKS